MRVSFIIPHKGREELLKQTIQSILDLDFNLQDIEVIVVTQNKTLECTKSQWNIGDFKVIFRPEHETISALRNKGVEQATGEYLVFLDADIQLSRNWLNVMFEELPAKPGRSLVSAMQRCAPHARIIEKIRVTLNNSAADSAVQFLDGRNLFMNRNIFQDVGGFPEHLVTCEDYYFTNKVHQRGEVYFTSRASYVHLGEDKNYAELFRKEIWRGQSNLRALRGRKIVFREIPSILIPLWQAFFLFAAILAVMLGEVAVILFCLLMVSLPSVLYAVRLYKAGKNRINFIDALWFYWVYHSARIIGTIIGVFKAIRL